MSADRTDIRSRALDLLRFPLAVVIVIVHVIVGTGIIVQGNEFEWDPDSAVGVGILAVKAFLSGQSVPIYFFISGYVFFLGFNLSMKSYARKMKNRFKSLFIPYMIWNTLAIIFILLPLLPFFHKFLSNTNISLDFSFNTILNMYWETGTSFIRQPAADAEITYCSNPLDAPLWFVRDLMIVAVTTPLINILLKRFGAWVPALLGIIWFSLTNVDLLHGYQLVTAYFFFSCGAYMSFNHKDMIKEFKRVRNLSFIAYPLLAVLIFIGIYSVGDPTKIMETGIHGNLMFVKNIAILAGLPFAYNLAVVLIERFNVKMAPSLTSASFFIYAGHWLIMHYITKAICLILPPDTGIKALSVLIISTAVIVALLLGTYLFMRRFCPNFLKPFTGGRI